MIEQKREVYIEMLYNRKVILAWNFIKIEKVKREISPSQKIRTVDPKTWQVLGFQICKSLTSTFMDMLQKRLKMGIIKLYHGSYRNLLYLLTRVP